ncbi:sphingosine kinase 2-like isoform X2 [Macrosteles quadrilineatus]|uniref:sphingosine kinase 2-like isoform X2 n=1 Tax=Macrosteles quadrilineatus TaxID=74068 RepID=UPI0023E3343E|nr:sphingosine kinase 2-like isoform X2 [Macrosteles quadrilineatus]XP_054288558.1 sphingosine kinase 2-like isoform X2 [Macrosteles quadrilineatus]
MMEPTEEVNINVRPMLEETFYILSKKNTVYRVKLTEKGLCLQKEHNGNIKNETISLSDIIGCRCMRRKRRSENSCACHPSSIRKHDPRVVEENSADKDESDISAYLYIYSYILKNCKVKSGQKRDRMTITLRFRSFDKYEDNMREAQKWKSSIKHLIHSRMNPQLSPGKIVLTEPLIENKVLVLLNPKSGQGKGRDVFQSRVVPLLTEADVNYDLHVTRYADDARTLVRSLDIYQYGGGLIAMGGDGILFEIINGMMERLDWETAFQKLKLGIIPCGSGNGLAKTISHQFNEPYDHSPVLVSALNVVRGFTTPMDLVRVQTPSQTMFSFLSVGWGLLSDIDIESERLRALGGQRFAVWSIARLIGLRTYTARLSYLRIPDHELSLVNCATPVTPGITVASQDNLSLPHSASLGDSINLETEASEDSDGVRRDSFYSVASRRSTYLSVSGSSYLSLAEDGPEEVMMYGPASNIPALSQPVPQEWTVHQGDFVMVHAVYKSHIAADCVMAPDSKLSDNVIWLSIIKAGISRTHLLQYLLGLSSGSHVNVAQTEMVPVRAFRLEPQSPGSYVTVDGERIPDGPFQVEMVPVCANVLARSQ